MNSFDAAGSPKAYKIPESVLVVIHTAELRVLLMERADRPGFWQSVTGSKDSLDEPLVVTATREVAEETGIAIADLPIRLRDAADMRTNIGAEKDSDTAYSNTAASISRECLRDWQLANVYDIYKVWQSRYAPGVTRNTEHVFSLEVPADTVIRLAPREHLQFCWLPYRKAADRCFSPSNAEAILQLPRRLRPLR
ncbi:MAG: dihydroneopterin triphosphate diphosphatase [Burkholderiaceae bacterium]